MSTISLSQCLHRQNLRGFQRQQKLWDKVAEFYHPSPGVQGTFLWRSACIPRDLTDCAKGNFNILWIEIESLRACTCWSLEEVHQTLNLMLSLLSLVPSKSGTASMTTKVWWHYKLKSTLSLSLSLFISYESTSFKASSYLSSPLQRSPILIFVHLQKLNLHSSSSFQRFFYASTLCSCKASYRIVMPHSQALVTLWAIHV